MDVRCEEPTETNNKNSVMYALVMLRHTYSPGGVSRYTVREVKWWVDRIGGLCGFRGKVLIAVLVCFFFFYHISLNKKAQLGFRHASTSTTWRHNIYAPRHFIQTDTTDSLTPRRTHSWIAPDPYRNDPLPCRRNHLSVPGALPSSEKA